MSEAREKRQKMRRAPALRDDAQRWQLDLDAARCYQQFIVPVVLQPWAAKLVDRATLCPGCRVLDLACGNGRRRQNRRPGAGPGGEIVGVDLNAPMLSVARSLDPVPGARVRWRRGDSEDLPFLDVSFDAVLCHQGFQFLPDRVKAAVEIARVLRPGGRLALSVWCGPDRNPLAAALIAVLESGGRPALSRAMRWAVLRAVSVRDYCSDRASRISRPHPLDVTFACLRSECHGIRSQFAQSHAVRQPNPRTRHGSAGPRNRFCSRTLRPPRGTASAVASSHHRRRARDRAFHQDRRSSK